jgi:hypothetical protein
MMNVPCQGMGEKIQPEGWSEHSQGQWDLRHTSFFSQPSPLLPSLARAPPRGKKKASLSKSLTKNLVLTDDVNHSAKPISSNQNSQNIPEF